MSTGDQSAYIRSKMAERGGAPAQFMVDGFDRWAESNAPARAGQMEKVPSEASGPNYGGAMTVSQAKKMQKRLGSDASQLYNKMTSIGEMLGGANRKIWGIELSDRMNDAANWTEKLANGFIEVNKVYDGFMKDLDRQIIKNTEYTTSTDKDEMALLEFAKTLKAYFEKWKAAMGVINKIAEFISKNLNQPPPPPAGSGMTLHGGATWQETWQNFTAFVERQYNAIKELFSWFYAHRLETYGLLRKLDSLQPTGKTVADVLESIFGRPDPKKDINPADFLGAGINMALIARINKKRSHGKSKMSGGKKCKCNGGVSPLDALMGLQSKYSEPEPVAVSSQHGPGPRPIGGRKLKKGSAMKPALVYDAPKTFTPIPVRGTKPGRFVPDPYDGPDSFIPQMSKQPFNPYEDSNTFIPQMSKQPFNPSEGGASCGGKKPSARGAIVKKVMREKGLSLPQASKYVKEHGLY